MEWPKIYSSWPFFRRAKASCLAKNSLNSPFLFPIVCVAFLLCSFERIDSLLFFVEWSFSKTLIFDFWGELRSLSVNLLKTETKTLNCWFLAWRCTSLSLSWGFYISGGPYSAQRSSPKPLMKPRLVVSQRIVCSPSRLSDLLDYKNITTMSSEIGFRVGWWVHSLSFRLDLSFLISSNFRLKALFKRFPEKTLLVGWKDPQRLAIKPVCDVLNCFTLVFPFLLGRKPRFLIRNGLFFQVGCLSQKVWLKADC